jgi:hypothetical protein
VLVDEPPRDASSYVEGFVQAGDPTIYLVTSSRVFRAAQSSRNRCGNRNATRKLASVIVHEEWHVRHGADERAAYLAQLTALTAMGAGQGTGTYGEVTRSMQAVTTAAVNRGSPGGGIVERPYPGRPPNQLLELTSRTGRLRSGPP